MRGWQEVNRENLKCFSMMAYQRQARLPALCFEEQEYRVVRGGDTGAVPESDRISRRLILPVAFTDSVLAGRPVTLRFEGDAEGLMNDLDDLRVKRAAYCSSAPYIEAKATPRFTHGSSLSATV